MRGIGGTVLVGLVFGTALLTVLIVPLLGTPSPAAGMTVAAVLTIAAWGLGQEVSRSPAERLPGLTAALVPPLLFAVILPEPLRTPSILAGGLALVLAGISLIHVWGVWPWGRLQPTAETAVAVEENATCSIPVGGACESVPCVSDEAAGPGCYGKSDGDPESECEAAIGDEEGIVQQVVRFSTPEGERLEGTMVLRFERNQRHASVHLPISPPFPSAPQGWCECDGEGEYQAEFDVLRPFGVRLTVRRVGRELPAGSAKVLIALFAEADSLRAA